MAADGERASSKKGKKQEAGGDVSAKKRKRDAEPAGDQPTAAPAPVQGGDAPAEGGEGQRKKKNRGHKRRKTEPENLDPAEAARRARQRELRELAMKLRDQGKTYVPPRKGGAKTARAEGGAPAAAGGGGDKAGGGGKAGGAGGSGGGAASGGGKDAAAGGDRKARHYLGDKTPGWRPFDAVEVIVLPIYWNNDKEEKAAVIAASERARDILASAGLAADMDGSNKYTPGQKMKYWETMGVRVRVELGPRDVANGNVVVALSTKKPGEVATKNIVNMRHKMLDAVREALGKVKSGAYDHEEEEEEAQQEEAEEQPEASEEATEEEAPAAKKGKKEGKKESKKEGKKSKQAASEEDEEEEQAAEGGDDEKEEAKPEKGAVGASADALEDDFGELAAVIEPEEDKLVLSKKERLKKMDKARKDQRKAERRAELGGKGGGGSEDEKEAGGGGGWAEAEKGAGKQKGKKAKVVKF
ncbi:hypothetical protein CHLRE_07g351300v5 [Chlamydomonas reinhardtii]|uniref:Anticodon-binding domain-containing protein n=1 Tax=Chlamydomonas reinhardtii TaxID=3055 RepID=A0A2K3DLB8_CHLRE|nr:uncharacterized protein CHLRE_07g351300v5 [Chlamydomonas reinhardtii]PNW81327.1 hypothetical protein CHLRE_07g351300v5 [Chlamydomonas reinhardtii]